MLIFLESMLRTNFSNAYLCYAEIKHFSWLKPESIAQLQLSKICFGRT